VAQESDAKKVIELEREWVWFITDITEEETISFIKSITTFAPVDFTQAANCWLARPVGSALGIT